MTRTEWEHHRVISSRNRPKVSFNRSTFASYDAYGNAFKYNYNANTIIHIAHVKQNIVSCKYANAIQENKKPTTRWGIAKRHAASFENAVILITRAT